MIRSVPSCTTKRSHSLRATAPSSTGQSGISILGFGSLIFSARFPGLPERILRRVGLGLRPRISDLRLDMPLRRDAVERLTAALKHGLLPGICLPSPDSDIDVERIDFDGAAKAASG